MMCFYLPTLKSHHPDAALLAVFSWVAFPCGGGGVRVVVRRPVSLSAVRFPHGFWTSALKAGKFFALLQLLNI